MKVLKGSCLCGAVTFETTADPQGVSMCHCRQCRKQSGGIWSSAYVAFRDLQIRGDVQWFAASDAANRGSCPRCSSFLFWKAHDENTISFSLGAVDGPTGLTLEKHIFTADKGDYYTLADDVPQKP